MISTMIFSACRRTVGEIPADVLSQAGYALSVEDQDVEEFAKNWVAENEDVVLEWLAN